MSSSVHGESMAGVGSVTRVSRQRQSMLHLRSPLNFRFSAQRRCAHFRQLHIQMLWYALMCREKELCYCGFERQSHSEKAINKANCTTTPGRWSSCPTRVLFRNARCLAFCPLGRASVQSTYAPLYEYLPFLKVCSVSLCVCYNMSAHLLGYSTRGSRRVSRRTCCAICFIRSGICRSQTS